MHTLNVAAQHLEERAAQAPTLAQAQALVAQADRLRRQGQPRSSGFLPMLRN